MHKLQTGLTATTKHCHIGEEKTLMSASVGGDGIFEMLEDLRSLMFSLAM